MSLSISEKASPLFGGDAFPRLSDWRADGALFAYQALLARRVEDPDDGGLVDGIATLTKDRWISTLLRPEVFSFLSNEPARCTWAELASAIEGPRNLIDAGGLAVMSQPNERFTALLRSLGKGSRAEDNLDAAFLTADSEAFDWSVRSIGHANRLLHELTPGYATDIDLVVDSIGLVDDRASFRGSSGAIHRGLIFLSPDKTWTPGIFAEEILHEGTHNLLDLISLRTPLIKGNDVFEEKYTAPFRPDKRHLYGNLHALIVVSRLIHLFGRLRHSSAADEVDWAARAKDYAERSLDPLRSVSSHDGLSPAARYLIDQLVTPTLTRAVEEE